MNLKSGICILVTAGFLASNFVFAEPKETATPKDNSPALDLARQLNEAFVKVAESVSPAVVVVTVEMKPGQEMSFDLGDDAPLDRLPEEFRRWFEEFGKKFGQEQKQQPKQPQ